MLPMANEERCHTLANGGNPLVLGPRWVVDPALAVAADATLEFDLHNAMVR